MFAITPKKITDQFYNTSLEHDLEHYCAVMSAIEEGYTPNKGDMMRASDFAKTMNAGLEAYKSHKHMANYLAIRESLAKSQLTPEELDYAIIGNICAGAITDCDDIDFDLIATTGYIPAITKIVSKEPETMIWFSDGDCVVVTCQPDETFDAEKGIYICLLKKALGPKNLQHLFKLMSTAKHVVIKDKPRNTTPVATDNDCCTYCEHTTDMPECVALDDRLDDKDEAVDML